MTMENNEKYKSQYEYRKRKPSKVYCFSVFLDEVDIINQMENQKSKAGYLKKLVLDDIERQSKEN